jgi:hypothetical protein
MSAERPAVALADAIRGALDDCGISLDARGERVLIDRTAELLDLAGWTLASRRTADPTANIDPGDSDRGDRR